MLPEKSHWLDLGASPGGMTSELLARGHRVTAVDRAPLDARLRHANGLIFAQEDVAAFRPRTDMVFDAIVCDLMMPHITGMDLYAELRDRVRDQAERIVFMTGGAFTPAARAFLKDVKNLRLEKPFDPTDLRSIINQRLR